MEQVKDRDKVEWFVLNVYAMNIRKAEEALKGKNGLPYFIPKKYAIRKYFGKTRRELVPLISNLVFVHATHKEVDEFQRLIPYLGFATILSGGSKKPMVVPEVQMENFIKLTLDNENDLIYFKPDEISLSQGDYVKIIGGRFDGIIGQFVRVQGKRAKHLVVTIPGVMSAATMCVEPEYIQKISKEEFLETK